MKKKILLIIGLSILILVVIYLMELKDNPTEVSINEFYEEPEKNTEVISDIIVHIDGSVHVPGIVTVPAGARMIDVISAAGGATSDADFSKINLAYIVSDAQKIYVPSINDSEDINYIFSSSGIDSNTTTALVNINTATQSELESLPGIGSSTAIKIIDYRSKIKKFEKIEDIMNVSGIGENKFNTLKQYISIK